MPAKTAYFKLFGGFSYKTAPDAPWVNVKEAFPGVSGKKGCLFLMYLIIYHKRAIPLSELMEIFWGENEESASNDPENALHQMLFKTRSLLKKMFPDFEKPVIVRAGQCRWNPEIEIDLDLEQFEELYKRARNENEKKTDLQIEAISMYKSGVRNESGQSWLEGIRIYYHTMYLDMCRAIIEPLQMNNQWIQIISICEKICELEPCSDEFVVYIMHALIMLGNKQMAIAQYESFRDRLRNEFDIAPSPEVEQMYAIAQTSDFKNIDGQDLFQILGLKDPEGAFFCSFQVFSHLVMIEQRHNARSGQASSLVIFTMEGGFLEASAELRGFERILSGKIRGNDAVARLNENSFIVLLSGAPLEAAVMVAGRVQKAFCGEFNSLPSVLSYQTMALPPLQS